MTEHDTPRYVTSATTPEPVKELDVILLPATVLRVYEDGWLNVEIADRNGVAQEYANLSPDTEWVRLDDAR